MVKRNDSFLKLQNSYLFPEITKRKKEFLLKNPEADLISLGIGDTTEPIDPYILNKMMQAVESLGSANTYSGYGPEQGSEVLRKKIAEVFYGNNIDFEDVYVSDGAKCDIGRLQMLFGSNVSIAVQDPAYPVYVDGSLVQGVSSISYMPCTPENNFFPDLEKTERTDLIYFCSPNNPTGAVATKEQLKKLVDFAKKNHSIIIFDSAYASFIKDPALPKSIYEIEGADEVAIEVNSFSKIAGFTGVRLGWTIVPKALCFRDGTSIKKDWHRLFSTIFNGASNIAQAGGLAVLEEEGLRKSLSVCDTYLANAKLIREHFEKVGYQVFGGINAPYVWVKFAGKNSWDVFQDLLEKYHVVCTPGSGFGPAGEGFVRFTAFGKQENIKRALQRFNT